MLAYSPRACIFFLSPLGLPAWILASGEARLGRGKAPHQLTRVWLDEDQNVLKMHEWTGISLTVPLPCPSLPLHQLCPIPLHPSVPSFP